MQDDLNDSVGMLPQDIYAFLAAVDEFIYSSVSHVESEIELFLKGLTQ